MVIVKAIQDENTNVKCRHIEQVAFMKKKHISAHCCDFLAGNQFCHIWLTPSSPMSTSNLVNHYASNSFKDFRKKAIMTLMHILLVKIRWTQNKVTIMKNNLWVFWIRIDINITRIQLEWYICSISFKCVNELQFADLFTIWEIS